MDINLMREAMIETLHKYDLKITNDDYRTINSCTSREQLDAAFDHRFEEKFLKHDNFNYEVMNNYPYHTEFYIGNGLTGYETKNGRYLNIDFDEED